ncbi:hypothetical protein PWT90_08457 [Aphanocladium album]|nr:hypothetical protein PWT90_08457 [Aphanocladium album]
MLRPATPLTVLLAVAVALLIISVISAPVTKAIYLGKADNTVFGVFGRCTGSKCSSAGLGYDDVTADGSSTFSLPDSVRKSLSNVLVLHPVAAGVALIMTIMAGISHTHGAAHSSRYLLILFVFILIAFLITIAAFIIDILLFLPHMAFGTYLVLAAAIILAVSAIVAFAMRRSMVGRKARRAKIAENAEMSGENYYNRENTMKPTAAGTFSSVPVPPTMTGANSGADGLPTFASYESTRKKDDQVSDERIPLTQARTNERSPGTNTSDLANSRSASRDRYGNQPGQQDPYGAPGQGYGPNGPNGPNGRPRGAMNGYRGGGAPRGGRPGYGGGNGGYGPPGAPMRGRGGYGRGGMGPRGRGGPYGQPGQGRDGYGGPAMAGAAVAGGAMAGAAMARGGRQGYDSRSAVSETYDAYNNQPANSQGYAGNWESQSNPGYADSDLPRAESPPPLPTTGSGAAGYGQAVEMAGNEPEHHGYGAPPINTTQANDQDVATGMVSMQQGHPAGQIRPGYVSDGSKYSTDDYVPPRAAWNQGSGRRSPRGQSPVYGASGRANAVEHRSPTSPLAGGPTGPGGYYEDVEPRYETSGPHPAMITSPPEPHYEDAHAMDGSRSPAGSERSNFTSVSQRGINPRWNPQQNPMPARRAVQQQRQDMILDNPDFQLAGGRGKPKHGNPSGLVPGSAYPNAPM